MRECGMLLPVASLPSKYGIGAFSKEAYEFIDLLKKSAFDVDMEYDCSFANRKMIQLYSNSLNIAVELFIEEIKNVEYVHD